MVNMTKALGHHSEAIPTNRTFIVLLPQDFMKLGQTEPIKFLQPPIHLRKDSNTFYRCVATEKTCQKQLRRNWRGARD